MATPEEVSGTHALTTAEQLFATLTAWHERVSVYVIGAPAGVPIANLAGARYNVYAINGSQRTLLATGRGSGGVNEQVMMQAQQGSVSGQGDTIALYVQNPFGVTAPVKAYLLGWDPSAAVTPAEASSVEGVTLTLNEQTVGDLSGGYVSLSTSFNPNGDPLAVGCKLRLYALLGGTDRVLMNEREVTAQEAPTTQAFSWLQNFLAGANEFIMTAQGRLGNSAVTVTGVLEGNTGSAGAGGGGGPPVGTFWPTEVALGPSITPPLLVQAPATSDVAPNNLLIRAQGAFATAATHQKGGNLVLESGGPASGGANGDIQFNGGDGSELALLQSNGIFTAPTAVQTANVILDYAGGANNIAAGQSGVPSDTTLGGSLFLLNQNNSFNSLFVKPGNGGAVPYVPVVQMTGPGRIQFDPAFSDPGIDLPIPVGNARALTGYIRCGQVGVGSNAQPIMVARDASGTIDANIIALDSGGTFEFGSDHIGEVEYLGTTFTQLVSSDATFVQLIDDGRLRQVFVTTLDFTGVGSGPLVISSSDGSATEIDISIGGNDIAKFSPTLITLGESNTSTLALNNAVSAGGVLPTVTGYLTCTVNGSAAKIPFI